VRIQRWFGQDKAKLMREFLKPLSIQLGYWLIYEIDDVLIGDEIPNYNMAKPFYEQKDTQDSIKEIMSLCDLITVTTQELADIYIEKYNLPKDKFVIIPNYLPRWWAGDAFDFNYQMNLWKSTRNKPRVAIACSLNHFDIHNKNNGIDDFSHVVPWIDHHIQKGDIQFIFVGSVPKQLEKYIQTKQIEFQPPSDVLNYMRELKLRKIDLLIAPLLDNRFNQCKSNIKWIECSAQGIPMAGQNMCTYNKYTNMLFNDGNDLENIVTDLFWKYNSEQKYADLIKLNKNIIDNGNELAPNGYWMEKNVAQYINLYSMPPKSVELKF